MTGSEIQKRPAPAKAAWAPAVAFAISVVATLAFWLLLPRDLHGNESSDYQAFHEPAARSILEGHWFRLPDGAPAVRYPPGYPLLLAGLFRAADLLNLPETTVVSGFTLLSMASASVLLFWLADSLWGTLPALACSLLWATYPFALWLTKQPNTEIPFVVLLFSSFLLFWRSLHHGDRRGLAWFGAGLLAGVAALVRPLAVGLGPLLAASSLFLGPARPLRVRAFSAASLLLGCALALAPWQLWLARNGPQAVVLSDNGATSVRDGLTFAVDSKGYRQGALVSPEVRLWMEEIQTQAGRLQSGDDILDDIHCR